MGLPRRAVSEPLTLPQPREDVACERQVRGRGVLVALLAGELGEQHLRPAAGTCQSRSEFEQERVAVLEQRAGAGAVAGLQRDDAEVEQRAAGSRPVLDAL